MADDSRLQAMAEEASTGETKEAANVGAALDEGKTAEPGLRGVEDAGDAPGSSLPCEEAVHDALHLQDSAVTGEEGQLTYPEIASGSSPTKPIAESIEPVGAGAASYRGAPATQITLDPPGTGPPSHAAFLPHGYAATGPPSQPTQGMADDSRLQAMAEEASTGETKEAANVGAALDEGKTAEPGLRGVEDAGDAPGSSLPCEEAVHDALHLQDSAVTGEEGQLTYPEIASGSSPTKPIAESIEPVGAGAASYRGAPATQITRDPPGTGPPSHAAFLPHGYAATGPPSQPTQGMADDSRLQAMAEEASTGETKEAANVGAALDEGKTAEPGLRGVEDAGDAPGSSLPCEEAVHDALHLQDSAVTGEEGQLTYPEIASGSSPTKPIAESIEPVGAGAASYRGAPATQITRDPPGTGPPSHAAFLPHGYAATGPPSQPTQGMADDSRLQAMAEEASTGETKEAANVGAALDEGKTAEPGLRGVEDAGDAPGSSLPCEEAVHDALHLQDSAVTGEEGQLTYLDIASGSSPTKPIAESIEPIGAGAASYRGAPATTQVSRHPPGTGPPSHAAFLPQATVAPKPSTHTAAAVGCAATGPSSQPTRGMADDSRLQAMAEEASTGETKAAANVGGALDEGKTAEPGLRGMADAGDAPSSSLPCEVTGNEDRIFGHGFMLAISLCSASRSKNSVRVATTLPIGVSLLPGQAGHAGRAAAPGRAATESETRASVDLHPHTERAGSPHAVFADSR